MSRSDAQFDKLARYLDGEQVELSAEEKVLAREIERDELTFSASISAAVPSGAMDRVWAKVSPVVLQRRPSRVLRFVTFVSGGMAAAAAILIVAIMVLKVPPAPPASPPVAQNPEKSVEAPISDVPLAPVVAVEDIKLDTLARDVNALAIEVSSPLASPPETIR